mmetsp:Transcript_25316/g.45622  ORF Transcript_25316/g.45622 Transcript_25316/m.45622 type:complete len:219 (-) Transcript_25316:34-690(-)
MMFHHHLRRQRHCRYRQPLATLLMVFTAASLLPSLLLTPTLSKTLNIESPLIFAEATNVNWQGNPNISPEHKAAHNAPRSQKYWDEHGIERPDYAKTDAEIAADRGQKGGSSGTGIGSLGSIFLVLGILAMASITYASITGDWDTVMNNPVGSFIINCINWLMEIAGFRGHRLGSSSTRATSVGNIESDSDADARRLARLARFDNQSQTNMLDNMKSE